MKNILLILGLLLGAAVVAKLLGASGETAGRIGIAVVFAFTAIGHFVQRDAMAAMIPESIPYRGVLVIVSGVFEALLAVMLVMPGYARAAGWIACAFLVLVTPLNIYSAVKRVNFGGHGVGLGYLAVRLPLQIILGVWIYWFCIRA